MDAAALKLLHDIAILGGPGAVIVGLLVLTPGGREMIKGLFGGQKKADLACVSQERCDKLMLDYQRVAAEAVGRANEDTRKSIETVHERMDKLYDVLLSRKD